jgi:hypothetical protein
MALARTSLTGVAVIGPRELVAIIRGPGSGHRAQHCTVTFQIGNKPFTLKCPRTDAGWRAAEDRPVTCPVTTSSAVIGGSISSGAPIAIDSISRLVAATERQKK